MNSWHKKRYHCLVTKYKYIFTHITINSNKISKLVTSFYTKNSHALTGLHVCEGVRAHAYSTVHVVHHKRAARINRYSQYGGYGSLLTNKNIWPSSPKPHSASLHPSRKQRGLINSISLVHATNHFTWRGCGCLHYKVHSLMHSVGAACYIIFHLENHRITE